MCLRLVCYATLMTGSQWTYLLLTILLISLTWAFFFLSIVPAVNHMNHALKYIALMLCVLQLSSLLNTAFTEPGIIPRAPCDLPEWLEECMEGSTAFCNTCNIVRPPRARHCRHCDNCVMVNTLPPCYLLIPKIADLRPPLSMDRKLRGTP